MCTELTLTSTAGGVKRTALSSPHYARDSDLNLIAREGIVAPQGAVVSFGQPDANGDVVIDISNPEPTTPPVVQTTTAASMTSSIPPNPSTDGSDPNVNLSRLF